ncbi:MAG: hypothetical protein RDU25_00395 [Patescibacteria group bacterium]|nr:hypothetical protein [Patescibacteria group bacterium]
MLISNMFPQLQNTNCLLLVCGKTAGKIFQIDGRTCELKETISSAAVEMYADKNPQVELDHDFKGHSKTLIKTNRTEKQDRLIKLIDISLREHLNTEHQEIFIFCPQEISKKLLESMQQTIRIPLEVVRYGNFLKFHPKDLLELIERMIEDRSTVHQQQTLV